MFLFWLSLCVDLFVVIVVVACVLLIHSPLLPNHSFGCAVSIVSLELV